MSAKEESIRLHDCGFNCAQSVLGALEDYTGLDRKTALAVSGGFGGGVRCGEICGALSGAVMALGMKAPYVDGEDAQARSRIAKLTMAMTRDFARQFGCVRCQDLKMNRIPCDELIAWAAENAETKLKELES